MTRFLINMFLVFFLVNSMPHTSHGNLVLGLLRIQILERVRTIRLADNSHIIWLMDNRIPDKLVTV